ncbi:putative molybdenum carrier protein [Lentisphaerota bacterium WC36G]|nr:putative molybdenum carrier protein [Lentisphaerae bacterium WC36]
MNLKIVSGGQTGADRAGLDVAIKLHIVHGGWCPKGRKAVDGKIAKKYRLKEMTSSSYIARTRQNVIDSDASVIFYIDKATGGTKKTILFCQEFAKDYLEIDLSDPFLTNCVILEKWFIEREQIMKDKSQFVLNIAGSRQTEKNNIYNLVFELLEYCLKE